MGRLEDKVIVVTGGASGIGAACARRFVAEGARVAIADVNAANGAAVADGLGGSGRFVSLDVAEEEQWVAAFDAVHEAFGRIDGLLNAAGIALLNDDLGGFPLADWDRILRVNLDGTFLGCKHAVCRMKETGGGSIVNIASIYGLVGAGDSIAYTASKGGVRMLTKSAALHCAKKGYAIRCNAVLPGFIETPMNDMYWATAEDPAAAKREIAERHLMSRFGTPEEVAAIVVYLMADESAFVTGAEFAVDGGYTAI